MQSHSEDSNHEKFQEEYKFILTGRRTKCSRQSSTAMNGGQSRLEIAPRPLFPAFANIIGSISNLSV